MLAFSEMGRYNVHFDISANEADASLFVSVNSAQSRTEVTFAEVRICFGSLLRRINRRDEMISRYVIVQQERRRKVQIPLPRKSSLDRPQGLQTGRALRTAAQDQI